MRWRIYSIVLISAISLVFFTASVARASFIQVITDLIVTVIGPKITQQSFRFYTPQDTLSLNDAWPPGNDNLTENTNIGESQFPVLPGHTIRLRMGVISTNITLPANNRQFKLQFAKLTSTCSNIISWTDLGNPGSTQTWRGADMTSLSDGTILTSNLLSGATLKGSYGEKNPTPLNPAMIQNQIAEYDWSLQNNATSDGSTYCFRMIKNDGTALETYTSYPQITLPLPEKATTQSTVDTSTGGQISIINPDNSRFLIDAPAHYKTDSYNFVLSSYDYSSYIDRIGSLPVNKVGANSFIYRAEATKDQVASNSFDQPLTIRIYYNTSDVTSTDENSLQIYKFDGQSWTALSSTIDKTNRVVSATTTSFSSFGLFGTASAPTPTPPPPSGGGGGGGGGGGPLVASPTSVTIKGKSYPNSTVSFLRDGQLISKIQADSSGNFNVTDSGLSGGGYNFSLWALDQINLRSNIYSFYLNTVTNSANNVFGVLMPPTITVNKKIIGLGESIRVFGSSVPNSFVILEVGSTPKTYTANSPASGVYSSDIDSKILERGTHTVKSKTKVSAGDESIYSNVITFGVGVQAIANEKPGDLNNDGKTNIVDFSILAFWYKRSGFPDNLDLNHDGKVDLKDFSILAFNWTG